LTGVSGQDREECYTYTKWFKRWLDAGIGFIVMPSVGGNPDVKENDAEGIYREAFWRTQWKAMGPKGAIK
jgi:hypothetical protein